RGEEPWRRGRRRLRQRHSRGGRPGAQRLRAGDREQHPAAGRRHVPVRAAGGAGIVTPVIRTAITGIGGYLPDEALTNADLAKIVETSDEWIFGRTGIHERRRAAPDQAASDLAVEA